MILIQEQSPKIAASAIKDFGKFSFRHNAVWLALSRIIGSQFFRPGVWSCATPLTSLKCCRVYL